MPTNLKAKVKKVCINLTDNETVTGAIFSDEGPWKGDWKSVPDNIFNTNSSPELMIYAVCLYVSGKLIAPGFVYNEIKYEINHQAYLTTLFSDQGLKYTDSTIDTDYLFECMLKAYA